MKAIMLNKVKGFSTILQKNEVFSIRQPKTTLLPFTASISKLLVLLSVMDIQEVQTTVKLLFRFANTIQERFTDHQDYQIATLFVCPATRLWLVVNNALGSKWSILDKQKLKPIPQKTSNKAAKEGLKTGIVNIKNWKQHTPVRRRILHTAASTGRTTPVRNLRFSPEVTIKNTLLPIEEIRSKAPLDHETFITIKTAPLNEGGIIGERLLLEQFHTICDNMWAADPTMVIYTIPIKIQHSWSHMKSTISFN